MPTLKASYYGAESEKNLNQNVAMFSSEVCPECHGNKIISSVPNSATTKYDIYCKRCNGDGWLTNPIKFIPEAMTCASNMWKLGTQLKITKLSLFECNDCEFFYQHPNVDNLTKCFPENGCRFDSKIIVMVTDRMALWLNSENEKYTYVCKECHTKLNSESKNEKFCCQGSNLIQTRDIDLTVGAFSKLAPLSKGLIEAEVEVL